MTSAQLGRQTPVTASTNSAAGVVFKTNGQLVTLGQRCTTPHFSTGGSHINLRPAGSDCSGSDVTASNSGRIDDILDSLLSYSQVHYALSGTRTLVLKTRSDKVVFTRDTKSR